MDSSLQEKLICRYIENNYLEKEFPVYYRMNIKRLKLNNKISFQVILTDWDTNKTMDYMITEDELIKCNRFEKKSIRVDDKKGLKP
jgi:hypothetical protein